MGVNVCLTLSLGARVDDVADAIGILAGLPIKQDNKGYRRVDGVSVCSTSIPTSPRILLKGKTVDGNLAHGVMFHYEGSGGRPSMIPPSTPFWVAVCRRLVDFFGGKLDYNDSDSTSVNYRRPCPRASNDPQDGRPWRKFEADLNALRPLTGDDLVSVKKYAAYKEV